LTVSYVLTAAAEADLRGIIRYTAGKWGNPKARSYAAELERGIERLAAGQCAFKRVDALYPDLRICRCEHHFIFCLPRERAPALIVAILHERMDIVTRLAGRLE
jgi:toxin ParE1/3/4